VSEHTGISWTDATFNPWWGCTKVSPACDHCYAERDANRFAPGKVLWGVGSARRTFGDVHWQLPLRWAKTMPAKLGRRPRVFCASMGDWLDLDAPIAEFVRLLDTIRLTPELDWLLLSKRIGNWRKRVLAAAEFIGVDNLVKYQDLAVWIAKWLNGEPPANVWLGATVIVQAEADRDIPKLLAVPARVRFLSIEPMLGPILLPGGLWASASQQALHWVIAGGESGPHARPAHPDWFRSLRDQCAAAGVPFHLKQWGEWKPISEMSEPETEALYRSNRVAKEHEDQGALDELFGRTCRVETDGLGFGGTRGHDAFRQVDGKYGMQMFKVGKKAAGRLLDGVEHNGFPEVA